MNQFDDKRSDSSHLTDEQLGGEPLVQIRRRKPSRLSNVLEIELVTDPREHADVVLRSGVPRTRGDCPSERPCGFVRCRYNTSRIDSGDRPGRRGPGHTAPPTTLHFVDGAQTNCALDLSRTPHTAQEIAVALGFHDKRRAEQLVRVAVLKLKAAGVTARAFMDLLAEEGHERQPLDDLAPLAKATGTRKTRAG